jgi:iron complex outermembrane receptor protein
VVTLGHRSALTQSDGRYVVAGVPAGADSLRARLLGYAPVEQLVEVVAGLTLNVDLAMTARAVSLAEVVVVGYGQQSAGNVTGAVSKVSAAEFNSGRIISPALLIQSKVPGVQVVDNNEPGGGVSIRIRGTTSVNASSEPLYVIDGTPVGSGAGGGLSIGRDPLASLNPAEIESITVLRDASAAAIYGANAANGVVLIHTKQGRQGTQFEYSGSMSGSFIDRLPSMLNTRQYAAAVARYAPQNMSFLANANTDWFSQIDHNAVGQDFTIALSAADPNTNWRLSLGYLNQDGVLRATTIERLALGLNFQQILLSDRLDIRASLKGSRQDDTFTPGDVLGNAGAMAPTQPVHCDTCANGYYEWPRYPSPSNPVAILNLAADRGTTYRSIGSLRGTYRMPFLESLRASLSWSYDVTRAQRRVFYPSTLHGEQQGGNGGTNYRTSPSEAESSLEMYLNYAAPLTVVPGTLELTGGYSYWQSHAELPAYLETGLSTDLLGSSGVVPARTVQNAEDVQESKLVSFFGRANYNLDDRYLAAVSLRRDGSSRFGPNNAWATFPSAALAWRISRERFLRGVTWLSDAKVRASWARTGNQAFANYQQYSRFTLGNAQAQVLFGNTFINTIRPEAYDPNIRWETTTSTDVGMDLGLWQGRLTGSVDWYNRNTHDLIFTVPVAAGTNLSNFLTTNIGSMNNKGVEVSFNARVLEMGRKRLGWTADFTASHNRNELTSIYPRAGVLQILTGYVGFFPVPVAVQVLQAGVPVNSFFVCRQVYRNGKPVEGSYYNLAGDSVVPECTSNRRAYHDPAPKWILTHTSHLNYARFDLTFTLRAYLGSYVYNSLASGSGSYAGVMSAPPINAHTSVLKTGFLTPQVLSDYYVEKASFLRMDDITLVYAFQWGAMPLRFFGSLQNAFTLTGYSGIDPTAGLNGLDDNIYPRSRTFTAGLNIRL